MTGQEKKSRNTIHLPDDLLVEILSRVQDASLARFRSTSKGWNSLIKKEVRRAKKSLVVMLIDCRVYSVRFDLHDNVAKVRSQLSLNDPLSNSSEEVDVRRVSHCDGLLLCTTMDERLVVWNPCSGETSRIIKPINSHYYTDTYALGKSTRNNEYKILRVHHRGHGFGWQCLVNYEIYDFTSNLWRVVGETREWSLPGAWQYGTSVDGNTYWLSYDINQACPRNVNTLGCFDFTTERFRCVPLPVDPLSYYVYALSVTREEQKLCLLAYRDERHNIDIWMATKIKSTGDMSWSKFLSVKRTHSLCNGMSFLADRENKVLVCPTKYKNASNCLHIVGTDKYIQVDHHDVGSESSLPYRYDDPTLVQIQRGSLGVGTWKAPMT
ncbi:hypothetical protein Bca52824_026177 [Brassica carinata]|uniref:F-box domain-containing protein n=1 Tax=Brassica carinata TaxID=52824 RepID=A0A8X7SKV7_BRACI|nr:hypothetical protein Bca52824_026177 [Brassica carinata]